MIRPLVILFLLGALQGLVGWIMVQSGLEDSERVYVSHYRLAIHFILALVLLCYTFWFALELLVPRQQIIVNKYLKAFTVWLLVLLTIQFVWGAFMAGLKAAPYAPTWPDMNGKWLPHSFTSQGENTYSGLSMLADNPIAVHFIHRNLAYLITVLIFIWWWKARQVQQASLFVKTRWIPLTLVLFQVLIGVLTVLKSFYPKMFLWLAAGHQFVAMLLLLALVFVVYIVRNKQYI